MSSTQTSKIIQIIVAKIQSRPPIQSLPPPIRGILNRVIQSVVNDQSSLISNSIDLSANKSLNKIPTNLIGPNNPVDLVNGNLDTSTLKTNINNNLDNDLSTTLSLKLSDQIFQKFTAETTPILKSSIDLTSIKNSIDEGSTLGINDSVDNNIQNFSTNLLTGNIKTPSFVPNVSDLFDRLGSDKGQEAINKDFDFSLTNDSLNESKSFDTNNNDNQTKLNSLSAGFIDTSSTFPENEYAGRTECNKLATGDILGTIVQEKTNDRILGVSLPDNETFDQPENPYNSEYPFNKVIQSESGHIIELDDTPGSERINVYHKSGSFIEIDQTGSIVKKTKGSSYEFVDKNDHLSILGEGRISVGGSMKVFVSGNAHIEVEGDTNLKCFNDINLDAAGKLNLSATEEINLKSNNINIESSSVTNLKTDGDTFISSTGSTHNKSNSSMFFQTLDELNLKSTNKINADGSQIHLNEGLSKTATYSNSANVGVIGERKSIFIQTIDDPAYNNYLDNFGYESEDTDFNDESALFLNQQKIAGLSDGSEIISPSFLDSETVTSSSSTIVQPSTFLLDKKFIPSNFQLSKHFTLGDLSSRAVVTKKVVRPQVGLSYGQIVFNLQAMALNVCEPVLALFPNMMVTSGFRPVVGLRNTSDHLRGQAVDMQFRNINKKDYYSIAKKLAQNLNYDKLLLEYKDTGTKLPWIHVSFKIDNPRKIILTYNNHKKVSSGLVRLA